MENKEGKEEENERRESKEDEDAVSCGTYGGGRERKCDGEDIENERKWNTRRSK